MSSAQKTLFLSYRRANLPWALAIFQRLKRHNYDIFFDFTSQSSGLFEERILANVAGRAHFVVLLTPSALDRCRNPDDLFRREIMEALKLKRNIVPVMLEGFDFANPKVSEILDDSGLAELKEYGAVRIHGGDDFFQAVDRLRKDYLDSLRDSPLKPLSQVAGEAAQDETRAAEQESHVTPQKVNAQGYFELAFSRTDDLGERIRLFTKAIDLDPGFSEAYKHRGWSRLQIGDWLGSAGDYVECIRLGAKL